MEQEIKQVRQLTLVLTEKEALLLGTVIRELNDDFFNKFENKKELDDLTNRMNGILVDFELEGN